MPVYSILGLSVFIPDLTDLTNFIVSPVQAFITSAFNAGGFIMNVLVSSVTAGIATLFTIGGAVINAITSTIDIFIKTLFAVGGPIISAIISGVTFAFSALSGLIISGVNALITGAINIGNTVYHYLISSLGPLMSNILANLGIVGSNIISFFAGPINTILTGISSIPGLVVTSFNQLRIALFDVGTQIINAGAATGQALLMSFQQGVDSFGKGLADLGQTLWTGLKQYVINPIAKSFEDFLHIVRNLFDQAFAAIQSALFVPAGDIVRNPWAAVQRIIGSILGIGTTIAIPMMAGELIHPLKQLGLGRLAAYFWDLADFKAVGGAVLQTITAVSTTSALRQGLNLLYRPNLPALVQADRMLFNQALSPDAWRDLYSLYGWRDEHINAWAKAFHTEPSDRLLLDMLAEPGIPDTWIEDKLTARGYKVEDRAILHLFGLRKKIRDELAKVRGVLDQQYQDGLIVEMQYTSELKGLGLSDNEIMWAVHAANLRAERQAKLDSLNAIRTAFRTGQLPDAEFSSQLAGLVANEARRKSITELERYRLKPSRTSKGENERKLSASQLTNLYVVGEIDEARLRALLTAIRYAGDDLELLVSDARRRKGLNLLS